MAEEPAGMEYDEDTGVYVVADVFDAPGDVHTTVVTAVGAVTDAEPAEMERLYGRIDPDALDAVFAPLPDGTRRTGGELTFSLAGCTVSLYSEGELRIDPD